MNYLKQGTFAKRAAGTEVKGHRRRFEPIFVESNIDEWVLIIFRVAEVVAMESCGLIWSSITEELSDSSEVEVAHSDEICVLLAAARLALTNFCKSP